MYKADIAKVTLIVVMIVVITLLHYLTLGEMTVQHTFYRVLYYVPLVVSALWYGLRGALVVCASIVALYLPYVIIQWQGFSAQEFDRLVEGVLFVGVSLLLGILTERERRNTHALLEAQSLAAVGRAVSEIAHDMKSPLMAIGGFVKQVARHMPQDSPDRKKLHIAIRETARLENMVREMLEFSRPVDLVPSEINVNEMVRNTLESLSGTAAETGIRLVADTTAGLPKIVGDREKINRILVNLITNAIQASPKGETVVVSTRSNKTAIIIEVTDHGEGIHEEHKESVFHPFFTTKKSGTGLGLGVAKKMTEAHGGRIYFYSNASEPGVTFAVELPLRPIQ